MIMNVNSVYDWSCKKLEITIPRNEISDTLLNTVLIHGDATSLDGRSLRTYSQEFQNLDSLEQWLTLLIEFFDSIPDPQPSTYEFMGLTFNLPDDNICKELLSQYTKIKKRLYLL